MLKTTIIDEVILYGYEKSNQWHNSAKLRLETNIIKRLEQMEEIQHKLVERLNAYHSDTMALMESPEAIYEWDAQLTLDINNEVYELLGINPPIQEM